MTDGQVNRAAGSGMGVYKVLGLVLLCLLAGAAGGLSYAAWNSDRAPVTKTADDNKKTSEEEDCDYVPASELGIRGKMRLVKYPAGYKVRVISQLWANGKFERNVGEDRWLIDRKAPGTFRLGVKTYDPSVLARNPGREIRVTFCRSPWRHVGWYERGPTTSGITSTRGDSPVELSAEGVGEDWLVSEVAYGGDYVPGPTIPTAEDLKTVGLYAGVWVRLEKLTPEDRNTPISKMAQIWGFITKPVDPNELS